MSRYYDMASKQVVFGDGLMPMDAFLSQGPFPFPLFCLDRLINSCVSFSCSSPSSRIADITESKLVTQAFQFAENIADLKMNDAELALFSAFVLISPGKLIDDGRVLITVSVSSSFSHQIDPVSRAFSKYNVSTRHWSRRCAMNWPRRTSPI